MLLLFTSFSVIQHFSYDDLAFGVDDERAAFGHAVFFDEHLEVARNGERRVAEHRELHLADGGGRTVPGLVREVRVGRDGVDLNAELLELFVVVGEVFELGRAHEREVGRVEEDDGPVTLEVGVGDGLELALMEGFGLEGQDFGLEQRHGLDPLDEKGSQLSWKDLSTRLSLVQAQEMKSIVNAAKTAPESGCEGTGQRKRFRSSRRRLGARRSRASRVVKIEARPRCESSRKRFRSSALQQRHCRPYLLRTGTCKSQCKDDRSGIQ